MTPNPAIADAQNPINQPPSTAGMTTKVVKGSLWILVGQGAPLAVSLIATPFIIKLLGVEGYGVLILVGLISAYLGFADFGMSMASSKFSSEAYAEGDAEKEGRIVRTAALIALTTSVPTSILLFVFSGPLITLFNVPEMLRSDATFALKLASITFVINFLCAIFNTPQLVRLRMDLSTLVNAGSRILGLIATPLVLYLGFGVIGAAAVLLVASLVNLTGHLIVSHRLLPNLVGVDIDRPSMGPLMKFGGGLVFAGIAVLLLLHAEKGIVSYLLSVKDLAFYSVAFTFAGMTTLLASSLVQSLVPAFSQYFNQNERVQVKELFSRATVMLLAGVIPVCSLLILISADFFEIWAGIEFRVASTSPFFVLIIGVSLYVLGFVPNSILIAVGRTDLLARMYWIELLPFLVIAFMLISAFGIVGAALAWALRVTADTIVIFFLSRRATGIQFTLFRKGVLPSALIYFSFAPTLIAAWVFSPHLLVKLAIFGVNGVSYLMLFWFYTLDAGERVWLRDRWNRAISGIAHE